MSTNFNSMDTRFEDMNPLHTDSEITEMPEERDLTGEDIPQPNNWKILVRRYKQPEKTAGGILLPTQTVEAQEARNYVAQIVALGPVAFRSEKFIGPDGPLEINLGDWVIMSTFSGFRIDKRMHDGTMETFHLHNDTDVLAKIDNPVGYKIIA